MKKTILFLASGFLFFTGYAQNQGQGNQANPPVGAQSTPDWNTEGNSGTNIIDDFVGTTDSVGLSIRTVGQERVRVTENGNIGIGTSSPDERLTVNGNISLRNENSVMLFRDAQSIMGIDPARPFSIVDNFISGNLHTYIKNTSTSPNAGSNYWAENGNGGRTIVGTTGLQVTADNTALKNRSYLMGESGVSGVSIVARDQGSDIRWIVGSSQVSAEQMRLNNVGLCIGCANNNSAVHKLQVEGGVFIREMPNNSAPTHVVVTNGTSDRLQTIAISSLFGTGNYLPLAGGAMTGDIVMGSVGGVRTAGLLSESSNAAFVMDAANSDNVIYMGNSNFDATQTFSQTNVPTTGQFMVMLPRDFPSQGEPSLIELRNFDASGRARMSVGNGGTKFELDGPNQQVSIGNDGGDYLTLDGVNNSSLWHAPMGVVINNDVEVQGELMPNAFKLTNGAQNGYVLTSDNNGNASWQPQIGNSATNPQQEFYVQDFIKVGSNSMYLTGTGTLNNPGSGNTIFTAGNDPLVINPVGEMAAALGGFVVQSPGNNTLINPDGGSVGVGTNSPSRTLTVNGATRLGSDNKLVGLEIMNISDGVLPERRGIGVTDDPFGDFNFYIHQYQQDAAFNFLRREDDFSTDAENLMTIHKSGNVGVGTDNPAFRLQIETGHLAVRGGFIMGDRDQNRNAPFGIITGTWYDNGPAILMNPADHQVAGREGRINLISYSGSNSSTSNVEGGIYFSDYNGTDLNQHMVIKPSGEVGIGTVNPTSILTVNGKITCEEVEVVPDVFPDYVFAEDYDLKPLNELENYINQYKHLPNVPSAEEVTSNGIGLKEMNLLLMEKVEELTLYMIEMNKQNEQLSKEVEALKSNR